jgi:hypothetical protein
MQRLRITVFESSEALNDSILFNDPTRPYCHPQSSPKAVYEDPSFYGRKTGFAILKYSVHRAKTLDLPQGRIWHPIKELISIRLKISAAAWTESAHQLPPHVKGFFAKRVRKSTPLFRRTGEMFGSGAGTSFDVWMGRVVYRGEGHSLATAYASSSFSACKSSCRCEFGTLVRT